MSFCIFYLLVYCLFLCSLLNDYFHSFVIIIIMTYAVPTFAQVFESMSVELPLPTRIVIGTSNFFSRYIWLLLFAAAGILFLLRLYAGTAGGRIRLARFRLFQEQVNGGLADCCEPTYEGVPYGSLNNGMRINLGVDVIRTISEHYGLKVPLVVDNAESVTRLAGIDTQVIRLVVSEADQALRVEVSE